MYLYSLHILGGWHGAGMAGLCARDSVLLPRLESRNGWFCLVKCSDQALSGCM